MVDKPKKTPQDYDIENLEAKFKIYSPKTGEWTNLKKLAMFFSQELLEMAPDCRERIIAIQKVEESIMWAQLGIERNS